MLPRIAEGDLQRSRPLTFVTGKGGTGKSTVAAALGLAAAARGHRTLVCELEGAGELPRVFGQRPASGEVRLAPSLWFLAVDPRQALEEWMRRQPGGAMAVAVLGRSIAFEHFVAAAPGVEEVVSIDRAVDLAGLRPSATPPASPRFDTVVVDCPSTGHALGMFAAPRAMGEVARVGPVGRDARALRDILADPARSRCVGITLPEDMPVREVLDLERDLPAAVGRPLDVIVVNGVYPDRFTEDEADRLRAVAGRARAPAAVRAALAHHARARLQAEHVRSLRARARTPVVTLPFLFVASVGRAGLETLARELG